MNHDDGLPFNADDIRHMCAKWRRYGLAREDLLQALAVPPAERRLGSLTDIEVTRIVNDEWPVEIADHE